MLAASFVGMAADALDEIIQLANTGRQQLMAPSPMRDSEHFQAEIGQIGSDLKAAQSYLQAQAATLWSRVVGGTLTTEPFFTHTSQTAIWTAGICTEIADACFALGGGFAVYDSSGLQRACAISTSVPSITSLKDAST